MDLLPPSILPVLQTLVGKQLCSRDQGVETAVGRHRTCCLEMRILLFVTVMIARSSRAVQRQLLLPVPSIILAGSPPVSDHAAGPGLCTFQAA